MVLNILILYYSLHPIKMKGLTCKVGDYGLQISIQHNRHRKYCFFSISKANILVLI